MLRHSFIHIPGVGPTTERQLWIAGIRCWSDLADACERPGISRRRLQALREATDESAGALGRGDSGYFQVRLPAGQAWRMFGEFHDGAAYLDIETDGSWEQRVTTVVLHREGQTVFFVRDRNLHELPMHLAGTPLLVTYNGKTFDWPVLAAQFSHLPSIPAHMDLRYPFAALGFRGGLKAIEKRLGIDRGDELEGIDGAAAVWLWRQHVRGDSRALPALLSYNAQDVLNLKMLAEWIYNAMTARLPVSPAGFACPAAAECDDLPQADSSLMDQCREELLRPWGC